MIQKNPFLKYLIKDEKKDIFHSSAYAKAQNGAAMGAASTESFKVRVNINQNRQVVRGYGDSKIMMDTNKNAPRAKVYTPPEKQAGVGGPNNSGISGAANARRMMTPKRPGISIK